MAEGSGAAGSEVKALDEDYLPQIANYEEEAASCRRSLDAMRAGLALLVSPSPWEANLLYT